MSHLRQLKDYLDRCRERYSHEVILMPGKYPSPYQVKPVVPNFVRVRLPSGTHWFFLTERECDLFYQTFVSRS